MRSADGADEIADAIRALLPGVTVNASAPQRTQHLDKGKQRADPQPDACGCACTCSTAAPALAPVPVDAAESVPHDASSDPIFYVGPESLALKNILLSHSSAPVFGYSPESRTARVESTRTNRMLMRRYAVVQKAKDADVFGLVVGTLGVASYLPLLDRLRATLRRHRKKVYTLAVGKLNPAKLANYLEIECFVLVACPENSLIEGARVRGSDPCSD